MSTLNEIFEHELQDLFSAESQLIAALPKMKQGSSSSKLAEAFGTHLEQTKEHKGRLEQIGKLLGTSLSGETCKAMQGLVKEGASILEDFEASAARDTAIIAAAQRVEHYEISAYGSALALAQALGHKEVAKLLKATLDEEKETDILLTDISVSEVIPAGLSENGSAKTSLKGADGSTGSTEDLQSMTKEELYKLAQEQEIEGRSAMTKEQLIEAMS